MPIGFGVLAVAFSLPRCDFVDQSLLVRNAAIETLARDDTEFGFSHVQPTSMFGRVVPLEALDQPARLGGREGLIE